ncbi:hypothetical protein F183_A32570 [Bryobacterales bacterium F-183]|nr:hypothetical protein F183_A32570 [Bryobacterales bacterium F-183]
MPEQNYQNHTQRVPAFIGLGLIIALALGGSFVNLFQSVGDHQRLYSAALLVVLTFCVLGAATFARIFALRAQDRAIRAEENLRHYVLTGKLLDSRLQPLQIVALRFASDAELPELARKAAEEGMAPDAIKQSVKSWRADTYRV